MQFVMISPTNTESSRLVSKAKAFNDSSTTITSEAIIVIWTMMRMLLGRTFRMALTAALDRDATTVSARHM